MKIVEAIKAKLVPNAREVLFSYWSIKAKLLGAGIPAAWAILPTKWQEEYFWAWIPQSMAYVTMFFLAISFACQFIKQDLDSDKTETA